MKLWQFMLVMTLCPAGIFYLGWQFGYAKAKSELPSCLYLNRPRSNYIKPWGCDGKEGIDYYCTEISGGGIYVSLHEWK